MPLHVSVLDGAWRVIEPVVVAITGPGGPGFPRDAPVLEGGIVAAEIRVGILFVFRHLDELISGCCAGAGHVGCRAEQDVLLAPEFLQRSHPLTACPADLDAVAEVAIVVVDIKLPDQPPLLEVAGADRLHAFLLGLGQRRQQQGRQDGNDGDDNKELDEGECVSTLRVHVDPGFGRQISQLLSARRKITVRKARSIQYELFLLVMSRNRFLAAG